MSRKGVTRGDRARVSEERVFDHTVNKEQKALPGHPRCLLDRDRERAEDSEVVMEELCCQTHARSLGRQLHEEVVGDLRKLFERVRKEEVGLNDVQEFHEGHHTNVVLLDAEGDDGGGGVELRMREVGKGDGFAQSKGFQEIVKGIGCPLGLHV
jgi:hypothetical protein